MLPRALRPPIAMSCITLVLTAFALRAAWGAPYGGSHDAAVRHHARAVFDLGTTGTVGPTVLRGAFAVVNFDGVIESRRTQGQFLFRRYPFGWQLIGMARRFRGCDLLALGVPLSNIPALDSIGSLPAPHTGCPPGNIAPPNPSADEIALRSNMYHAMPQFLIDPVVIVGSYAIVGWSIHGGGQHIFTKKHGAWHQIAGGGGSLSASDLVHAGVPAGTAQLLDHRYRMADIRPG